MKLNLKQFNYNLKMIRLLLIFLIVIVASFLFLRSRLNENHEEMPVFLQQDIIATDHKTIIETKINSIYKPDSVQLQILKKDYSNLWAHLNHLYATNDVETGKEYYTEGWFKQINHHFNGTVPTTIKRIDLNHNLYIENWAWDGLVCAAKDSNVVFQYQYPDQSPKTTIANLEIVLLFQGDHWRVDALKVIDEKPVK